MRAVKAKSFVNQNFNLKKMLKEYEDIYYKLKISVEGES